MSISSHISQLREKHAVLERRIEETSRRPSADEIELTSLKRRKLQIKEEIARLGGTD